MFNQFVACSDVQDALIFKRFRFVHVRFEFEIAVSRRFKVSGMLRCIDRDVVAVVSKVG